MAFEVGSQNQKEKNHRDVEGQGIKGTLSAPKTQYCVIWSIVVIQHSGVFYFWTLVIDQFP